MSVSITLQPRIYVAQYDVSGDSNKVAVENPSAELNATVFTNTAEKTLSGLFKPRFSGAGFVTLGANEVHERLRGNLALADVPVTVCPETGAAGEVAVFMKSIQTMYNVGAAVGEILPFTVEAKGRGIPAISGKLFIATGAKTSSGNSGVIQLGSVPAGKKVYASLHVLSVSGTAPTLDVTVASDDASGFTTGITQLTFPQATATGYGFQASSGAEITDTWWRVNYTIGGTTPSFSFIVAVGIF